MKTENPKQQSATECSSDIRLEVKNLSFAYQKHCDMIKNVSLRVRRGQFVGIIGPNGSGKSTVLKNIYRALKPREGEIYIDGINLYSLSHKESALKIAVVGQENEIPFDFTVEEIVSMGRSPHKKLFEIDTQEDKQIVENALRYMHMENMAERNFTTLSGGEKQRVVIARAIAQQSDFLLLDEPTNHLDIGYQIGIFDFIKSLNLTVLSAIHDLNLASLYCDYLFVLEDGKIVREGTPEEVLTKENLQEIYGVRSVVQIHHATQKPNITFLTGLKPGMHPQFNHDDLENIRKENKIKEGELQQ